VTRAPRKMLSLTCRTGENDMDQMLAKTSRDGSQPVSFWSPACCCSSIWRRQDIQIPGAAVFCECSTPDLQLQAPIETGRRARLLLLLGLFTRPGGLSYSRGGNGRSPISWVTCFKGGVEAPVFLPLIKWWNRRDPVLLRLSLPRNRRRRPLNKASTRMMRKKA